MWSPMMMRNRGNKIPNFNSDKAMVGTGPFKFVEWIPGNRMIYTRNDEYRGEKAPWTKVILKPFKSLADVSHS